MGLAISQGAEWHQLRYTENPIHNNKRRVALFTLAEAIDHVCRFSCSARQ